MDARWRSTQDQADDQGENIKINAPDHDRQQGRLEFQWRAALGQADVQQQRGANYDAHKIDIENP